MKHLQVLGIFPKLPAADIKKRNVEKITNVPDPCVNDTKIERPLRFGTQTVENVCRVGWNLLSRTKIILDVHSKIRRIDGSEVLCTN